MQNAKCRMKKKFEQEPVGSKAFEQERSEHRAAEPQSKVFDHG
jgi:hypothetical protein